jgi:hypothetical protein
VDRSITGHASFPYMEQIAQREKRNTEDCACQIKIMADAVLLSPMHKCKPMKCFRDMRKNHQVETSCTKHLQKRSFCNGSMNAVSLHTSG